MVTPEPAQPPTADPAPPAPHAPTMAEATGGQAHGDHAMDKLRAAGEEADRHPGRLVRWASIVLAVSLALWLAGFLVFRQVGTPTRYWNIIWGLSGISFLFVFVPLPGFTASLLLALSFDWVLGLTGVAGAAVGCTIASAILLALGHEGREMLRRKATKSPRARRLLEWSQRAAKRWTYVGVFLFLIPQFIPRAVTLYAAILAKLRTLPFLVTVFLGTYVRNLVMLVGFHFGVRLLGL